MFFLTSIFQLLFITALVFCFFKIGRTGRVLRLKTLLILLVIKLIASYANWTVYTFHYQDRSTSDTYKYFDDGMTFYHSCKNSPALFFNILLENENIETSLVKANTEHWDRSEKDLFNSNRWMIKTHLILAFVSHGNIHIHLFFFSIISSIGTLLLFLFFYQRKYASKNTLLFCFFLTPSFVFWNSAMLKESFSILAMGIMFYSLNMNNIFKFSLPTLLLCLSSLLLYEIKPYLLFCIFPALLYLSLKDLSFSQKKSLLFSQMSFLCFVGIISGYGALEIIISKHNEFVQLGISESANSLTNHSLLKGPIDLLYYLPQFIVNLFRPTLFEINSLFFALNAIENTFVIFAIILIIWRAKHIFTNDLNVFILIFCIYYLILIGSTVPIIGALVRYKSIILPFIFLIPLSYESIQEKIKLSWLNKLS